MVQWAMPSTDVLPRLVATDPDDLKSYIAWAVTCHGPSVDLNHIDVSAIQIQINGSWFSTKTSLTVTC